MTQTDAKRQVAALMLLADESRCRAILQELGTRAAVRELGIQCAVREARRLLDNGEPRFLIMQRLMLRYGIARETAYLRIAQAEGRRV